MKKLILAVAVLSMLVSQGNAYGEGQWAKIGVDPYVGKIINKTYTTQVEPQRIGDIVASYFASVGQYAGHLGIVVGKNTYNRGVTMEVVGDSNTKLIKMDSVRSFERTPDGYIGFSTPKNKLSDQVHHNIVYLADYYYALGGPRLARYKAYEHRFF